jgi:hypothetical protein
MPVFCPHCHKMVAEQPQCPNCGKAMKVAKSAPQNAGGMDRELLWLLLRESLGWMLGILAIGVLCILALYFLLG